MITKKVRLARWLPTSWGLLFLERQRILWQLTEYTELTGYQGLIQAEERHGFEGDGFAYLRNPLWWAGIATRKC